MPQILDRAAGRRQRDGASPGSTAVEADGPVGLVLTRQDIPVLAGTAEKAAEGLPRGGYVLVEADGAPQVVLVGTGSEVQHCVGAAEILAGDGVAAQVVSLPCWEWFDEQPDEYRATVLPDGVPVLSIEAGSVFGWERYADDSIGIDHFGASAPVAVVMEKFGFTAEHVVERAKALLARRRPDESGSDRPET